jgi:hypothetical protein
LWTINFRLPGDAALAGAVDTLIIAGPRGCNAAPWVEEAMKPFHHARNPFFAIIAIGHLYRLLRPFEVVVAGNAGAAMGQLSRRCSSRACWR